ncbi:EscU/YscU/HrcU family type III secretion system export apparatus switch protein [Chelativorans sp.]|uniref:EscU/YscU/HrcU family type III secretion system export apparatus switch protein n=1 Tax=Chelativorans sp. TaxID=2203393 RepID=UPI00281124D2|nr:EscU/YscU/HrcU family type III secretion system export apparatus switch protein [Chelativorans sp.]
MQVTHPSQTSPHLVALRYLRGETPLPAVVARGQGGITDPMAAEARRLGMPIVMDPPLLEPLFGNKRNGAYIAQDLLSPVVRHLSASA